jgi:hypothetical protein
VPTYEVETVRFADSPPVEAEGCQSWHARAQNFLVGYSTLKQGASLRAIEPDYEHVLGLVEGTIRIESESGSREATADAIAIVPPGESRLDALTNALLFRVFAPPPQGLAEQCLNWSSYATPRDNVAPFELWPAPVDGYKLRIYQYADMPSESRKIFRSRNIMVNWEGHPGGPRRDLKRFTPHSHEDFEQGSLELWGSYVHHLRYPWEADSTAWRADQRLPVTPPGLTIMPVNVIHTSQGMADRNCLADLFAPPRLDFSLAGYVYNADDYPMPDVSLQPAQP